MSTRGRGRSKKPAPPPLTTGLGASAVPERDNDDVAKSRPAGAAATSAASAAQASTAPTAGGEQEGNQNTKQSEGTTTAATSAAATATTTTTTTTTRKMMRLRKEIESLHEEMEVAQYGRVYIGNNSNNNKADSGGGGGGHFRRVLPRNQSKARTQKRKLLESQDAQESSVEQFEYEHEAAGSSKKRLRGPTAAANDAVIQGSLIFGTTTTTSQSRQGSILLDNDDDGGGKMENVVARAKIHRRDQQGVDDGDDDDDDDDALEEEELDEEYEPVAEEDIMEDEAEDDEMDDDEDDQDGEDDQDEKSNEGITATQQNGAAVAGSVNKKPKRKYKKKMYQLKNFRSHRMAQRHGEAIGAFVQGRPKVAIAKLKELAHDAPLAPQVYSSLGMVYEDMLRTYQKECEEHERNLQSPLGTNDQELVAAGSAAGKPPPLLLAHHDDEGAAASHMVQTTSIDKRFAERLDLAKKAYGSFHIAAILCRQDYTIWVRAADMAMEIAVIHERIAQLPGVPEQTQDLHCEEKVRWLSEAKNDYQTADKLQPPGIDVPAKLASIMIELGHLSDALTLLTDLKNQRSTTESSRGKPSEFESSYQAWLLYSDLMLRIGFECIEWSRGSEGNSNYSFRRWLRKWADSFDWQERRTQALVKALEAAAGTKSCRALLEWMEQRALTNLAGNEAKDDAKDAYASNGSEANVVAGHAASTDRRKSKDKTIAAPPSSNGGDVTDTREDTPLGADDQAEDGKQDETFLLKRNQKEIEDFDKTTKDLGLAADSIVAKERDKERLELVTRHSQISVRETRSNSSKSRNEANGGSPKLTTVDSNAPGIELPLVASVPVEEVCNIASDLMRHVLDSGLYEGGRLVSEAVASYMKNRAAVRDDRMLQRETRRAAQRSSRAPDAPLAFTADYDNVNNSDSDDESSFGVFEEDEYDEGTYDLMRRGVIPPDLQVMYALSLACLGGRNFVASKCLETIGVMEQKNVDWLSTEDIVAKDSVAHSWLLFRQSRTGRLGRIDAFVMVANVMKAAGKEKDFVALLKQLFSDEQERLDAGGLLDASVTHHASSEYKKDQIVTLITALARYKIFETTTLAGATLAEDTRLKLLDSIELISELAPCLFTVNDDGSLSLARLDMIRTVADVHMLLSKNFDQSDLHAPSLSRASQSLSKWMLVLSRCPDPDVFNLLPSPGRSQTPNLKECPYASSWQSLAQLRLSERCFSLLVAMNVSSYCGWGSIDSSYLLPRQRDSPEYFGVILTDIVAGHLPASCEEEMVRQWDLVSQCQPDAVASLNLSSHLANLHGSIWYRENTDSFHREMKTRPIARFGEDAAIDLFFSFSKVCLLLATQEESNDKCTRDVMLSNALSILLPVLQFGLHRPIWKSEIGGEAATQSVNKWRVTAMRNKSDAFKTRKRAPSMTTTREKDKKVAEGWFKGENFIFPLSNLIAVPMAELRCLWRNKEDATLACHDAQGRTAGELMRNVHVSMKQLRRCFTEHATERQSHKVAVSLFELAEHHLCENPFFCLQQAAQFATQSPKRANSDEPFKAPLPRPETCTPREAMIIIGRADCLQSLHFCDEAAFLCNYAASLCSRHRVSSVSKFKWSKEWNVISILTYNLSVMIRITAKNVLKDDKAYERFEWSPTTLEELQRGRFDGLTLTRRLPAASAVLGCAADHPDYTTTNENATLRFAQAREVDTDVFVDETRERDTARTCMESNSQPTDQLLGHAPDHSHFATVSDDTTTHDKLFKNQQEGQSQFPSFANRDDSSVSEVIAV